MHAELIQLLRKRETIIADHAWRDRDSAEHLAALKDVSEAISDWTQQNQPELDPKLRHFLGNASFAKALFHLESAESGI